MSAFATHGGYTALQSACVALILAAAALAAFADEIPASERRSGYEFMGKETRAMQDDDAANPGMLWVLDGEALWGKKAGASERACSDCHGDARASMKGVAARYPAFDAARARPVNLEQRINFCRAMRQKAPPLAYESKDLLRSRPSSGCNRAACRSRSRSTSVRCPSSTPAAKRSIAARAS